MKLYIFKKYFYNEYYNNKNIKVLVDARYDTMEREYLFDMIYEPGNGYETNDFVNEVVKQLENFGIINDDLEVEYIRL